MPSFGVESTRHLNTLHPDLQKLALEVIKYVDHSITCGYRNEEDQNKAFDEGKSQKRYPNGEHNKVPSMAMDVAPYPIVWKDSEAFTLLAGVYYGVACMLGLKVRIGADWDGDFNTLEHSFKDRPHIELVGT